MTKLKLEVGKYYRTRDGRRAYDVGPYDGAWSATIDGEDEVRIFHPNGEHYFGETECDLISEWGDAPSSPVQLRKVIVPGVYGGVSVKSGFGENVGVAVVGDMVKDSGAVIGHCWLTRADLIAARDVFNALIDAMPNEK